MGFLSKAVGSIGNLNFLQSGGAASAKAGYQYSSALAAQQNAYQKEFAQNGHQWEMADLKAAGLNPALTATGGSGATTGGAGGGGSVAPTPQSSLLGEIMNIYNNTRATSAQSNLQDAEALKTLSENDAIPQRLKNETMNTLTQQLVGRSTAKFNNERSRGFIKKVGNSHSFMGFGGGTDTMWTER